MKTYCAICKKYTTKLKKIKKKQTKQNRLMLLSNCTIYG